ncbi:MAG: hypothetical protein HC844_01765 [Tabrizicola sp.]|nr:hypothetical protein [Tabrizicola sp.]
MTDTYGLIEVVFHGGGISLRGKSDSMARIDWQALLPGEPYRYSYAGEADAAGHTYVFSAQGTATLVASDILIDGHSFAKIRLEDELYLEGSATPMGVAVYLYWSPEIGLPIEGETGVRQRDGSWLMDVDSPPVEVRSPGEPGFDATEPTLNCNILGSVVRPEASASA